VGEIAFGTANIDRQWWRGNWRLPTKQKAGDNEKAGAETSKDSV